MPMTFATKVVEQKGESKFVTGTGTAGQAGSASVAYKPSLWKFDMGMTPVAGDMVTIKIPVEGNSSGVWLSVNNGTTYYPIAVSGNSRLTTHYPNGYVITVVFETGFATKLYGNTSAGGAAGASLTSYTIDRWRIHNYYDSGNTNTNVTQTATTTNANYEVLFSATADNTTRTEGARKTSTLKYNPNTKALSTGGTVNGYTLADACAKGVTDNSSNADVTSSDTNLITGRTLYYQLAKKGYTTNTGTITGITMNGASKGTSGVVDLGTVITDVSGKADTSVVSSDSWTPASSTTLLSYITSTISNKVLPYTFVKISDSIITDGPITDMRDEFICTVSGEGVRLFVELMLYGGGKKYKRSIFSGNWAWAWEEILTAHQDISGKVDKTIFLPAGTDFNNIQESGFYRIADNNTNLPSGANYGQLIVSRGGDTLVQLAFDYDDGYGWIRVARATSGAGSGIFSSWQRITTENMHATTGFVPNNGETLLPIILSNLSSKTVPFSIMKLGSDTHLTDTPSEVSNMEYLIHIDGCEYNNIQRYIVTLTEFRGGVKIFNRDIIDGAWDGPWRTPDGAEAPT